MDTYRDEGQVALVAGSYGHHCAVHNIYGVRTTQGPTSAKDGFSRRLCQSMGHWATLTMSSVPFRLAVSHLSWQEGRQGHMCIHMLYCQSMLSMVFIFIYCVV